MSSSTSSPPPATSLDDWVVRTAQALNTFRQDTTTTLSLPTLPPQTSRDEVRAYIHALSQPRRFPEVAEAYVKKEHSREVYRDLFVFELSREIPSIRSESGRILDLALRQNVWHYLVLLSEGELTDAVTLQDLFLMLTQSEDQAIDQAIIAARFLLWERILVSTRRPKPYCLIDCHRLFGQVFAMWLIGRVTNHFYDVDDHLFCGFILFYEKFVAKPVTGTITASFISNIPDAVYEKWGLALTTDEVEPSGGKLKRTQTVADPFRSMVEALSPNKVEK